MASVLIVGGGSLFLGGTGAFIGWILNRGSEKMVRPIVGEPPNYLDSKVREAFARKLTTLKKALDVEERRWFVSLRRLSSGLESSSAEVLGELILVKRFLEAAPNYLQVRSVLEPMVADVKGLADRVHIFLPVRAGHLREEARLIVPQTITSTIFPSLQERGLKIKGDIEKQFSPVFAMWYLTTWFTEDPEVLTDAEKWADDMARSWDVVSKGESAFKHSNTVDEMQRLADAFFLDASWEKLKGYYGMRARSIESTLKPILDGGWTIVSQKEIEATEEKESPPQQRLTYAGFQVEALRLRTSMEELAHYREGEPIVELFFQHIKQLDGFWKQRAGKAPGYTETLKSIAHEIRIARWFQERVKQQLPAHYLIINPFLEGIDPPQSLF